MNGASTKGVVSRARGIRYAFAALLFVCLAGRPAMGQRHTAAPHAAAPHAPAARPPAAKPQGNANRAPQQVPQYRGAGQQNGNGGYQYRGAGQQTGAYGAGQAYPSARPAAPGAAYQGQGYAARPAYSGSGQYPGYAPPGHLGAWLNSNRSRTPQAQQQMLHNDPSFNRLPEAQQQRLMQQLNRVNQMPEAQRERRLARAENLERLSPQERAQVQDAGRRFTALPPDRRAVVGSAFRDLSSVPPDQRATVLNSARYQNNFSPDERGILSNMLKVEPYDAPK
jgi:hypothetical protein